MKFRVPHTLILLLGMVFLAQVLTYILPQGQFERVENEHGDEQVVAGTYAPLVEPKSLDWYVVFTALPKGFEKAQDIIFFIFIVGGAFGVFRASGAADAVIATMLRTFSHKPFWLISGTMLLFGGFSSTIGMAEEYIPFIPLLIGLCVGLGYDRLTAVGILCVAYGTGYGVATLNPFTVVIAQQVAGLQVSSGMGFRLILSAIFLPLAVHHVWSYACKVKRDPSASLIADVKADIKVETNTEAKLDNSHLVILAVIAILMVVVVYGIKVYDWYLVELMGLFIALSLVIAIVARIHYDDAASAFCEGAAELTTTALLVGVARTVQLILSDGMIIDTIIVAIAEPLSQMGPSLAAIGMFAFQCVCNFFIPSGSGQAFVTMPVMAPIGDLVGVSRQTAVLAFQFGDGFTNILVPTNAVLIGILGLAGVPYDRWLRFILPFFVKVFIVGSIALVVATMINY